MTQPPAEPQDSNTGTVIAAAAIGLALIAIESQVRQQIEEDIAEAITVIAAVFAAALATALATPAVAAGTALEILSTPKVHSGITGALSTAKTKVTASIRAGYTAGANVAFARAKRELGVTELPELDTTADVIIADIDTMFRHAQADIINAFRVAYDGVQGDDADRVRPIVVRQGLEQAAARLQQRAAAAAGTAVNQGASDAQQAIWDAVQNQTTKRMFKRWTVTSATPCGMCLALNGTLVPVDSDFDHDAGADSRDWRPVWRNLLGPPRHPNCRCQLELVTT